MKKILFVLFTALLLASCEDPALEQPYGDNIVYMPQATHNLGVDNNLNVSLSAASVNADASHKTSVTLGVYRSGTAAKEAFSVDLKVVADTLAKAKAIATSADAPAKFELYKTAVLLESRYYEELPGVINVPDGERQATVQLVLDDKALYDNYPIGQALCLPVRIDNPSKYELNESLALTMVVVNLED